MMYDWKTRDLKQYSCMNNDGYKDGEKAGKLKIGGR